MPLHAALDRIAREQGFASWSLLAARSLPARPEGSMLPRLAGGDLLLLGARPGHGKTMLGLRLLLDAVGEGRKAVFFTLEYTLGETRQRLDKLEDETSGAADAIEIVTSDDICADYVIHHLADAPEGTVAVIDYLQILDQRRDKPVLSEQIEALREFADKRRLILAFISQIDRSYDPGEKPLPDLMDIRLPNRLDIRLFSKSCFLHEGRMQFGAIRP